MIRGFAEVCRSLWEAFIELDNWKQGDWSSKTNCQLLFKTHFVIVRVEVCGGLMSITSLLLSEIAQVAATVWAVTLILPQPTTLHCNKTDVLRYSDTLQCIYHVFARQHQNICCVLMLV